MNIVSSVPLVGNVLGGDGGLSINLGINLSIYTLISSLLNLRK